MTDYTDLIARGMRVYVLEGQYDWWGMVDVQTDATNHEGSGYWVKAEDAAAAIAALTAERDALRERLEWISRRIPPDASPRDLLSSAWINNGSAREVAHDIIACARAALTAPTTGG